MRNRQITMKLIFEKKIKILKSFSAEIFWFSDLVKIHPLRPAWRALISRLKRKKSRSDGRGSHNTENFWKTYSGIFWKLYIVIIPRHYHWDKSDPQGPLRGSLLSQNQLIEGDRKLQISRRKKILNFYFFLKNQIHADLSIPHVFCVFRAISSDLGEYLEKDQQ